MEFIVEILFEIVLQILVELGFEFTMRKIGRRPERESHSQWTPFLGYAFLGFVFGCLSIAVFREHFIKNLLYRKLNLIVSPLLMGFIMSKRGKMLIKKGDNPIQLDTFSCGFLFALIFGVTRYFWAS